MGVNMGPSKFFSFYLAKCLLYHDGGKGLLKPQARSGAEGVCPGRRHPGFPPLPAEPKRNKNEIPGPDVLPVTCIFCRLRDWV